MTTWAAHAGAVIWPLVEAGRQAGTPPAEILRQIDAAYPFGERAHFPYQQWLKVRREARGVLGLLPSVPHQIGPLFGEASDY